MFDSCNHGIEKGTQGLLLEYAVEELQHLFFTLIGVNHAEVQFGQSSLESEDTPHEPLVHPTPTASQKVMAQA